MLAECPISKGLEGRAWRIMERSSTASSSENLRTSNKGVAGQAARGHPGAGDAFLKDSTLVGGESKC